MTVARTDDQRASVRRARVHRRRRVVAGRGRASRFAAGGGNLDPATGQFTAIGSLPEPPSACPVPLQDGRLLLIGTSSYFFETATNAFTPARLMAGEFGSVLRLADGRILIAGHLDGDERPLPARIFNPLSETEVTVGAMVHGRSLFSMTLLADGRVLVAGGTTLRTGQVLPAELFDPATGRFMEIAATPRPKPHSADGGVVARWKGAAGRWMTGTPGAELFLPESQRPLPVAPRRTPSVPPRGRSSTWGWKPRAWRACPTDWCCWSIPHTDRSSMLAPRPHLGRQSGDAANLL